MLCDGKSFWRKIIYTSMRLIQFIHQLLALLEQHPPPVLLPSSLLRNYPSNSSKKCCKCVEQQDIEVNLHYEMGH